MISLSLSSTKIGTSSTMRSSTSSECSSHTRPYFFSLISFSTSLIATKTSSSSLCCSRIFSRNASILCRLSCDKLAMCCLSLFTAKIYSSIKVLAPMQSALKYWKTPALTVVIFPRILNGGSREKWRKGDFTLPYGSFMGYRRGADGRPMATFRVSTQACSLQ